MYDDIVKYFPIFVKGLKCSDSYFACGIVKKGNLDPLQIELKIKSDIYFHANKIISYIVEKDKRLEKAKIGFFYYNIKYIKFVMKIIGNADYKIHFVEKTFVEKSPTQYIREEMLIFELDDCYISIAPLTLG